MSDDPTLSLVVIRVSDLERAASFYSAIGLLFEREQHGSGPEHYAAAVGGTTFELYPSSERHPVAPVRLGFTVTSIDAVLSQWRHAGGRVASEPEQSPWGLRAVVEDPDGHRIELSQRLPARSAPKELLEVYSTEINYAVIKTPGRHFPGAVIQGDSLSILCRSAQRIAEAVRDKKTDDEEFPAEVEYLLHSLFDRLRHYQYVLQQHGLKLPYFPPVTDANFIKLTPPSDDDA